LFWSAYERKVIQQFQNLDKVSSYIHMKQPSTFERYEKWEVDRNFRMQKARGKK